MKIRLIDADLLIALLPDIFIVRGESIQSQIKSIINSLPIVEVIPKWIPCSERLPKETEEYLITIKPRHGDTYVKKTMYFPDDELWWDISPFETVTAWMPVPKPYEEE